MRVWVPASEQRRHTENRARFQGQLEQQLIAHSTMEEYNRELKRIDEHLQLAWAPENADPVGGVIPGRWHILRWNEGAPPSVIPLERDGEYAEPGSWIYDELRVRDLWQDDLQKERRKAQRELERAQERRKAREAEERSEELRDRLHALEPGVSMTKAGPWSYRAGAKRG